MGNKSLKNSSCLLVLQRVTIVLCIAHSVGAEALMKLLGGKVTLNCSFPSSIKEEPDKVIWQLNNNNLIVDGTRLKKISASVLEISDLQYRDSGLYACFVESKLVNKTLLIVEGKPQLTAITLPVTPKNGSKISMECVAVGYPRPFISWQQNGVKIKNGSDTFLIFEKLNDASVSSKVEIFPVTYLNNGTLSCVASNKHGSVMHEAAIQVHVPAVISTSPQKIYLIRKGSDVTIQCSAFGNPRPSLIWRHSMNTSSARYREEVTEAEFSIEKKITIQNVTARDAGNFTCITANSVGSIGRGTGRVIVQDVPRCCHVSIDVGTRNFTAYWGTISDGNSRTRKYSITLRNKFFTKKYSVGGSTTTMKFDILSPGWKYELNVTAENAVGVSNTISMGVKTIEEEYTQCIILKPRDVHATTVKLTWHRKCNLTVSGKIFLDVMVFQVSKLIKVITNESSWQNSNKTVTGLLASSSYQFKVREVQPGHIKGFESQLLSLQSAESAPTPPRNVEAVQLDSTSLEITWDQPEKLNGIIREYELWYSYYEATSLVQVENRKSIDAIASPQRRFVLKGLMMNTRYNVSVRERTDVRLWSKRSTIRVTTKEGVPAEAPQNVSVRLLNDSIVVLQWNAIPSTVLNGDLIGYVIIIQDVGSHTVVNRTLPPTQLKLEIKTLKTHEQYEATIFGTTRTGAGKEHSFIFFTANGVPSVPRHLQATVISSNSVKLTWTRPEKSNGMITEYQIKWKQILGAFERMRRSVLADGERSINGTPVELIEVREHFIRNLTPHSTYSFRVREKTATGWGPFTKKIQAVTNEGESTAPENLRVTSKSSTVISFRWNMPSHPNGDVRVFVVKCYQGTVKDFKNITIYKNKKRYEATCRNLKSLTETTIMVYAVSSVSGKAQYLSTFSAAPEEAFPWLPIIGGCVGFVVVVALILTIVLICRRKVKYMEVMENVDDVEMNGVLNGRPIHIANLKQYVLHNHANSDHGFFTEYKTICQETPGKLTWEHSMEPVNQHKNRYSNVVAYDNTRVVLNQVNRDPTTTYINANYIDGYKHPRKFIATQGPLPETVKDFWRMIYEQNCQVIVMLTKVVEDYRVKCEEYWPDRGSAQYGSMMVKSIEVTELSDYVIRTFSIKSVSDVEAVAREVKQYHYLGWPDNGVPEYPTSMVAFTKYVMDNAPPKTGPIVVHCSAGVGRTGTLIVIDAMMNQIREENIIDVYKYVSAIRRQRNFMVQTEAQYVFIYDALLDAVICGNTEATAHDIAAKLRYLDQQSHDTPETYLMQEFKRLEAGLSSQEKELFSIANLPENKEKNRFLNILPYNRNRVKLASIYGQKGSDYINASYIDGYRQRHVFIATQGPLESTVPDFWRMVWEQNSHNIVMLTRLTEKGKERSRQYWPPCGSECYGKFLVDELRESDGECENVVIRELNLTYTETGRTRRVVHYLYTGWPEYGSPNSGTDLIKLISMINEMAATRGNGPVIVHCSGGAGRTGAFIALHICIQKLNVEGTVDIFQTVRQLRTQRPAMVQTIDQYYFCYQALKDYVDTTTDISKHYDLDESLA